MAVNDNNNVNNTNTPDLQALAQSPYGDLELTKYLYESGLQNIFNTYQQNVATLDQSKQQELQDAYTVREMSKKYLGEYASNVGIGDVSGNLLDIYGQYQSNLSDIERNYGQLELGLEQEYLQTRQQAYNDTLLANYNIEVAKLEDQERNVLYNLEMGQTNGLTDQEYIDKEFADGRLRQDTYQQASMMVAENQRTQEERELWGRITRGELDKDALTAEYEAGNLSVEAYNEFFGAMDQQEQIERARSIELDLVRGNTQGLSNEEYLNMQREQGLSDDVYNDLLGRYVVSEELSAQQTAEQKELERQSVDVRFNVATGRIPEGMDMNEYLDDAFNKGLITSQEMLDLMLVGEETERGTQMTDIYETAKTEANYEDYIMDAIENNRISEQDAEVVLQQLQAEAQQEFLNVVNDPSPTKMYGYDDDGNLILSQEGYMDAMRGKVGEEFYQEQKNMTKEFIDRQEMNLVKESDTKLNKLDQLKDDDGITKKSKTFIRTMPGGITKQYAVAEKRIEEDPFLENKADIIPDYYILMEESGDTELYENKVYTYRGNEYIFMDGNIHRIVEFTE